MLLLLFMMLVTAGCNGFSKFLGSADRYDLERLTVFSFCAGVFEKLFCSEATLDTVLMLGSVSSTLRIA